MIIASHTRLLGQIDLDIYAAKNGTVYLFDTDEIIVIGGAISYIKMGVKPIGESIFNDEVRESIFEVLRNVVSMTDIRHWDVANHNAPIKVGHRQVLAYLQAW